MFTAEARSFEKFYRKIKEFDFTKDNDNLLRQIKNDLSTYYQKAFLNPHAPKRDEIVSNLLLIQNLLKINSIDTQKIKTDFKNTSKELSQAKEEYSELIELLRGKAGEESVEDYAQIFQNQAERHSHVRISKWKLRIGGAERWFSVGIIFVVFFIYYLFTLQIDITLGNQAQEFTNIDSNPTSSELVDSASVKTSPNNKPNTYRGYSIRTVNLFQQILKKLLIFSFLIFGMRFSFKQYLINKHLAVINKHRQNTLNSFRLFLNSIDKDDVTRNALMLEVAKAIYDIGKTGYLVDKGSDSTNPSIIELTKLVSGKSQISGSS